MEKWNKTVPMRFNGFVRYNKIQQNKIKRLKTFVLSRFILLV